MTAQTPWRTHAAIAACLFVAAWLVRTLFGAATADAAWDWAATYKGDAPYWLSTMESWRGVHGAQPGVDTFHRLPMELRVPLRPPGMLWLLQTTGVDHGRSIAIALGAAVAPLTYLALMPHLRVVVAATAGILCVSAQSLLALSSGPHVENPFLVLVLASLLPWSWIAGRNHANPTATQWVVGAVWFGLTSALACLFRAEHALAFAGLCGLAYWLRDSRPRWVAAVAAASFAATLVPHHLQAWHAIERVNHEQAPFDPPGSTAWTEGAKNAVQSLPRHLWQGVAAQLEQAARSRGSNSVTETDTQGFETLQLALPLSDEAAWRLEQVPAYARASTRAFIDATTKHRRAMDGGNPAAPIELSDFDVVEQAYGEGTFPEPLPAYPFIALYGGLNLYLAHVTPDQADGDAPATRSGGFSSAALSTPPPLAGGAARYPADWLQNLPEAGVLALEYPPHLALVNHGTAKALAWIGQNPVQFLKTSWHKLVHGFAGAATGWTGWGFPVGASGTRAQVDMVTADGFLPTLWRMAIFALVALGFCRKSTFRASTPWLVLAVARGLTVAMFFGYARLGALLVPVIATGIALALDRFGWLTKPSRPGLWFCGTLVVLVGVEGLRTWSEPTLTMDGVPAPNIQMLPEQAPMVGPLDAFAFREREVEYR